MPKYFRLDPTITPGAEHQALVDAGYTGSINDMTYAFLVAQGYTGSLTDMLKEHNGGGVSLSFSVSIDSDGYALVENADDTVDLTVTAPAEYTSGSPYEDIDVSGIGSGPVEVTSPAITGTLEVGNALDAPDPLFFFNAATEPTPSYQWERDTGAGYSDISGALSKILSSGDNDAGGNVRRKVSLTDDNGTTVMTSPVAFVEETVTFAGTNNTLLTAYTAEDGFNFTQQFGGALDGPPYIHDNAMLSGDNTQNNQQWVQNGRPNQTTMAVRADVGQLGTLRGRIGGVSFWDGTNSVQVIFRYNADASANQFQLSVTGLGLIWVGDETGTTSGTYTCPENTFHELRLAIDGDNLTAEIDGSAVTGSPFDISASAWASGKPGINFFKRQSGLGNDGVAVKNFVYEGPL